MESGGGDRSTPSPSRTFDAANLIGVPPYSAITSSSAFGHLSQVPSAFSMLGRLPMFPPTVPFGGLGSIPDPLRSPGSLSQSSSSGLNGGISESSMFQLPSFSTTTTTTTTSATSSGNSSKSPVIMSTTVTPSKSSSISNRTNNHDSDRDRRSTPQSSSKYKNDRKRTDSTSSDQSKDNRSHKPSKDWSNNPLSVESLTNAESASGLMGIQPYFFPFGTVANSLTPFSGLPFSSPLMAPVSSVYSSLGLFPSSSMDHYFTSASSPHYTHSSRNTPSVKTTSSSKLMQSVISSPKSSRTEIKSADKSHADRNKISSPSLMYSKSRDVDYSRDHLLSPIKSPHTSVITSTPKSSTIPSSDKKHRLDHSTIATMEHQYGSRKSSRLDDKTCLFPSLMQHHDTSRRDSTHHDTSRHDTSRHADLSSPQKQSDRHTDSVLNLTKSSTFASETPQDGVMDLSMKKTKTIPQPSTLQPSSKSSSLAKTSSSSSRSTPSSTKSEPKSSSSPAISSAMSLAGYDPALLASSLFSYPGGTDALTASALMEAQKELMEKHAAGLGLFSSGLMSGGSSKMAADLSYNYAAAAAAAMMPPFYDSMTASMFLHPMMASMAAAAVPMSTVQPSPQLGRGGRRGRVGRGRGRGRGSRSMHSLSKPSSEDVMSMFKSPEVPTDLYSIGENRSGSRGGKSRGRGRGRRSLNSGSSSGLDPSHFMGLPLAELEWQQQRLRQEQLRHELEVELKQQQMQTKLAEHAQSMRERDNKTSSSDDQHHDHLSSSLSSRLAQALMGETLPGPSQQPAYMSYKSKSTSETSGTPEEYTEDSASETDSHSALDSEGSVTKRRHGDDQNGTGRKRRRTILDETELRIPLEHGWRRETKIRAVNERGIFGEVIYYTPCAKKLRTYPEVEKYLSRNNITDLTRDNFTFSTQVSVGDLYEYNPAAPGEGYVLLSEAEVMERYVAVEARRKRIYERKLRIERRKERKRLAAEMALRMAESRMHKKMEQQGNEYDLARKVEEIKMRKKVERQQQRDAIRRAKQVRVMELKKMRERQRMMKQQEKAQKQRQIQIEREIRAQQAVQEKEMKKQSINVYKDQEKERRRQHLLLLKAMDARKKLDDKERQKEEKRAEKQLLQQRRLEQRRLELEMAREMKKPVEDMRLKDLKDLPELDRLPGVRMSGQALADCLMVVEFMQNFGSCLGYDAASLPTLNMIQGGLLNDPYHVDDLNMFVMQLLRNALDDPGVPNPRDAITSAGQKIMEVDLNEHSISEVLRIFIRCRNGKEDEMSLRLTDHPFQSLTTTHKAAILAFLCNELLCGKNISGEIDKNIESINNYRRDKWIVEGKLRKMKMIQAKRFRKTEMTKVPIEGSTIEGSNIDADDSCSVATFNGKNKKHDDDDDDDNESVHESYAGNESLLISDDDEEQNLTNEELEKKIDRFSRQHGSFNDKVSATCNKLRAINLGQDRYKRRYWVLPHCGGVFVEGMESGEPESEASLRSTWLHYNKDTHEDVKDKLSENKCNDVSEFSDNVKDVVVKLENEDCPPPVLKEELITEEKDVQPEKAVETVVNGISKSDYDLQLTELQNGATVISKASDVDKLTPEDSRSAVESKLLFVNGLNANASSETSHVDKECNNFSLDKIKQNSLLKIPCLEGNLSNGNSGNLPLVNGDNLLENLVECDAKIPNVPPLIPFKSSLIRNIIDKRLMEKISGKESSLANGMAADMSHDLKSPDLKVMDLTMKAKENYSDSKPILNNHNLEKDSTRPLEELIKAVKSETVFSQSDNKSGIKTSPLKVPVLKTSLNSGMSYRSIDSILSPDSKTLFSTPGSTYSRCSGSSSIMSMASPHDHLMKNMSVAVNNSGELVLQSNKQSFAPWISILPRKACDTRSITRTSPSRKSASGIMSTSPNTANNMLPSTSFYQSFEYAQLMSTNASHTSSTNKSCLGNISKSNCVFLPPADIDPNSPIYALHKMQHPEAKSIPFEKQQNWWKINNVDKLREVMNCLHPRGIRERLLQKTIERCMDLACTSITKGKHEVVKLDVSGPQPTTLPIPEEDDLWYPQIGREVELGVLDEVENMEDRICHASLQGFKMPPKVKQSDFDHLVSQDVKHLQHGQQYILDLAKSKLLALERNIERRYLKPPFCKSQRLSLASLTSTPPKETHRERERDVDELNRDGEDSHREGDSELADLDHSRDATQFSELEPVEPADSSSWHMPKELGRWRDSVSNAQSASQIMVYMLQLNDCISWEKSIMKVSCQICCHDDNEAELLLCDSCDKGYHTYCFKPRMDDIPEGDWYCYECISRATGEACCVVCGKAGPKLAECEHCPRSMHTDCMDPPLARCPKKWCCAACSVERVRGKGLKKRRHRLSSVSSMASYLSNKDKPITDPEPKVKVIEPLPVSSPTVTISIADIASSDLSHTETSGKKERKKHKRERKSKEKPVEEKVKEKKPRKERKCSESPAEKLPKKKRKSMNTTSETENSGESPPKKKRKKKKNKEKDVKKKEKVRKLDLNHSLEEQVVEALTDSTDESKLVIDLGAEGSSAAEDTDVVKDSLDMSPCVCMMDELEKHEESWPFLHPVDCRRFPSYKKFIKKPMDFQTMRKKLRDSIYQSREEFANDLRLVCDNCCTFNEDDSAVGQAGHTIRSFFEKRWKELCDNSIGNSIC